MLFLYSFKHLLSLLANTNLVSVCASSLCFTSFFPRAFQRIIADK